MLMQIVVCAMGPSPAWAETRRHFAEGAQQTDGEAGLGRATQ
jgi:hypothetical protein